MRTNTKESYYDARFSIFQGSHLLGEKALMASSCIVQVLYILLAYMFSFNYFILFPPLFWELSGLTLNTPGDLAISLGTSDTVSSTIYCFSK